ncbi:mucin-2 isoform X2 [Nerophis ophidion]|uniref:mucin-2 isoform X2 n=1 Tax=Nerophis ophidion TaxID=159077 RepID=UPI002AE06AE5|nr:mucin-2 isoform X2 [Nerophis ophidion]
MQLHVCLLLLVVTADTRSASGQHQCGGNITLDQRPEGHVKFTKPELSLNVSLTQQTDRTPKTAVCRVTLDVPPGRTLLLKPVWTEVGASVWLRCLWREDARVLASNKTVQLSNCDHANLTWTGSGRSLEALQLFYYVQEEQPNSTEAYSSPHSEPDLAVPSQAGYGDARTTSDAAGVKEKVTGPLYGGSGPSSDSGRRLLGSTEPMTGLAVAGGADRETLPLPEEVTDNGEETSGSARTLSPDVPLLTRNTETSPSESSSRYGTFPQSTFAPVSSSLTSRGSKIAHEEALLTSLADDSSIGNADVDPASSVGSTPPSSTGTQSPNTHVTGLHSLVPSSLQDFTRTDSSHVHSGTDPSFTSDPVSRSTLTQMPQNPHTAATTTQRNIHTHSPDATQWTSGSTWTTIESMTASGDGRTLAGSESVPQERTGTALTSGHPLQTSTDHGATALMTTPSVSSSVLDYTTRTPTAGPPDEDSPITAEDKNTSPSSTTSQTRPSLEIRSASTARTLSPATIQPPKVYVVPDQPPAFRVESIELLLQIIVEETSSASGPGLEEDTGAWVESYLQRAPGFSRLQGVWSSGHAVQTLLEFHTRGALQWLAATGPSSLLEQSGLAAAAREGRSFRWSKVVNITLGGVQADVCDWLLQCPAGFQCASPPTSSNFSCPSSCHFDFCHHHGICTHHPGQLPVCRCLVGEDFWFMGSRCDVRMTRARLVGTCVAILLVAVAFICALALVAVRRYRVALIQAKVDQTRSSYRRFNHFDELSARFWQRSTAGSADSMDNPAFTRSDELLHLRALDRPCCYHDDTLSLASTCTSHATRLNTIYPNSSQYAWRGSEMSVGDGVLDSGKASDLSVCSWPVEPIHWTPFPLLRQLASQRTHPVRVSRPRSYCEGMELTDLNRSWTA